MLNEEGLEDLHQKIRTTHLPLVHEKKQRGEDKTRGRHPAVRFY